MNIPVHDIQEYYAEIILHVVKKKGFAEVLKRIYLQARYSIEADQDEWPASNVIKRTDFSVSEFWIISSTHSPAPIYSAKDLADFLEKHRHKHQRKLDVEANA